MADKPTTIAVSEDVFLELELPEVEDAEQAAEDGIPSDYQPRNIRVFGKNHEIIYSDTMTELGLTDYHSCRVIIKEGQLPVEEADTVLHEIIHVIDYTMDLEMTEHQVRSIATGLIGVFQDNPLFAQWICEHRSATLAEY